MTDQQNYDLYGDLEEFGLEEKLRKQNEKYDILQKKYICSIKTIENLMNEIKELKSSINLINKNFSSLLITARAEIKRKDNQIAELRREKDDLCFRRFNRQPYRNNQDQNRAVVLKNLENELENLKSQHSSLLDNNQKRFKSNTFSHDSIQNELCENSSDKHQLSSAYNHQKYHNEQKYEEKLENSQRHYDDKDIRGYKRRVSTDRRRKSINEVETIKSTDERSHQNRISNHEKRNNNVDRYAREGIKRKYEIDLNDEYERSSKKTRRNVDVTEERNGIRSLRIKVYDENENSSRYKDKPNDESKTNNKEDKIKINKNSINDEKSNSKKTISCTDYMKSKDKRKIDERDKIHSKVQNKDEKHKNENSKKEQIVSESSRSSSKNLKSNKNTDNKKLNKVHKILVSDKIKNVDIESDILKDIELLKRGDEDAEKNNVGDEIVPADLDAMKMEDNTNNKKILCTELEDALFYDNFKRISDKDDSVIDKMNESIIEDDIYSDLPEGLNLLQDNCDDNMKSKIILENQSNNESEHKEDTAEQDCIVSDTNVLNVCENENNIGSNSLNNTNTIIKNSEKFDVNIEKIQCTDKENNEIELNKITTLSEEEISKNSIETTENNGKSELTLKDIEQHQSTSPLNDQYKENKLKRTSKSVNISEHSIEYFKNQYKISNGSLNEKTKNLSEKDNTDVLKLESAINRLIENNLKSQSVTSEMNQIEKENPVVKEIDEDYIGKIDDKITEKNKNKIVRENILKETSEKDQSVQNDLNPEKLENSSVIVKNRRISVDEKHKKEENDKFTEEKYTETEKNDERNDMEITETSANNQLHSSETELHLSNQISQYKSKTHKKNELFSSKSESFIELSENNFSEKPSKVEFKKKRTQLTPKKLLSLQRSTSIANVRCSKMIGHRIEGFEPGGPGQKILEASKLKNALFEENLNSVTPNKDQSLVEMNCIDDHMKKPNEQIKIEKETEIGNEEQEETNKESDTNIKYDENISHKRKRITIKSPNTNGAKRKRGRPKKVSTPIKKIDDNENKFLINRENILKRNTFKEIDPIEETIQAVNSILPHINENYATDFCDTVQDENVVIGNDSNINLIQESSDILLMANDINDKGENFVKNGEHQTDLTKINTEKIYSNSIDVPENKSEAINENDTIVDNKTNRSTHDEQPENLKNPNIVKIDSVQNIDNNKAVSLKNDSSSDLDEIKQKNFSKIPSTSIQASSSTPPSSPPPLPSSPPPPLPPPPSSSPPPSPLPLSASLPLQPSLLQSSSLPSFSTPLKIVNHNKIPKNITNNEQIDKILTNCHNDDELYDKIFQSPINSDNPNNNLSLFNNLSMANNDIDTLVKDCNENNSIEKNIEELFENSSTETVINLCNKKNEINDNKLLKTKINNYNNNDNDCIRYDYNTATNVNENNLFRTDIDKNELINENNFKNNEIQITNNDKKYNRKNNEKLNNKKISNKKNIKKINKKSTSKDCKEDNMNVNKNNDINTTTINNKHLKNLNDKMNIDDKKNNENLKNLTMNYIDSNVEKHYHNKNCNNNSNNNNNNNSNIINNDNHNTFINNDNINTINSSSSTVQDSYYNTNEKKYFSNSYSEYVIETGDNNEINVFITRKKRKTKKKKIK